MAVVLAIAVEEAMVVVEGQDTETKEADMAVVVVEEDMMVTMKGILVVSFHLFSIFLIYSSVTDVWKG